MVAHLVIYPPLVGSFRHYLFYKSLPLNPIQNQMNPMHVLASNALYVFPICAGVVLYRNIPIVAVFRPKFCRDYEI